MSNGIRVRSDWLKMYRTLHTWVGITSGLLLFIGFLAGALTMFEEELQGWSTPASARMTPASELTTEQLDSVVAQVLEQYPAARADMTVHLEPHEHTSGIVSWHQADEEGGDHHHGLELDEQLWWASLDQQGELKVQPQVQNQLGELIDQLHRSAGIAWEIGHDYAGVYLMGIAALLYSIALTSGLVLVLPTLFRDFLTLRAEKNRKRFWLDAHNLVGITSLPFHIVIAFTVVVFAFHDLFYDSLDAGVYGEQKMFSRIPVVETPPPSWGMDQLMPMSGLIDKVRQQAPEVEVKSIELRGLGSPRAMARIAVSTEQSLTRGAREGYILLDPYSGRVANTNVLPGQQDSWSAVVASFFGMHFGSFGGSVVQWLYFALGIGGAFLFYSGNLLWITSRRKRLARDASPDERAAVVENRSVRWMAAGTQGVCLGTMAGLALAMLAARWGHLWLTQDAVNLWVVNSWYLTFFVVLGWAFVRGLAGGENKAGRELLFATSLTLVTLPLAELLGWLAGMPVPSASVGVAAVALASAILLGLWGRKLVRSADRVLSDECSNDLAASTS